MKQACSSQVYQIVFKGSNYTTKDELDFLLVDSWGWGTERVPENACGIHYPKSYDALVHTFENGWRWVNGEEVLCIKSDLWLTEGGDMDALFFYRLLKPSPIVQAMMDEFKLKMEWLQKHVIGVHVRRGDLTIYSKNNEAQEVKSLIPLENYINAMKKAEEMGAGSSHVRFFLATDDVEAEAQIKAAFPSGYVMTYEKQHRSRTALEGVQEAMVDVMLLADCPILIGTYYSSYSETAKMIGWPFYIQVGQELSKLSLESQFKVSRPVV